VPLVDTIVYNAKRAEVQGETLDALASYVQRTLPVRAFRA